MENRPWIWLGLVAMVAVATACSEDKYAGGHGGAGDDIGVARFALTAVPADVACIKVTANGTKTKKQNFDVTPGTATVLTMGGLPTGTVTFTADAFSVPCAMVTSTTPPSWVADPITTDVAAGVVTSLSLVMRQTGTVDISIDFAPPADSSGIAGGATHTCAVNAGSAFCWGGNAAGQLGLGHQLDVGDDAGEIEGLPPIDFGFGTAVTGVVAGDNHSCALVDTAATSPTGASVTSMRCWGAGATGQLGLGSTHLARVAARRHGGRHARARSRPGAHAGRHHRGRQPHLRADVGGRAGHRGRRRLLRQQRAGTARRAGPRRRRVAAVRG